MSFIDRFRRKNDEGQNQSTTSFGYLDSQIRNSDEIILDSDIILEEFEESDYPEGIAIDRDNITIDGNGHSIDARGKARIFRITGSSVRLKNLRLINGHAGEGGAVLNGGKSGNDGLHI